MVTYLVSTRIPTAIDEEPVKGGGVQPVRRRRRRSRQRVTSSRGSNDDDHDAPLTTTTTNERRTIHDAHLDDGVDATTTTASRGAITIDQTPDTDPLARLRRLFVAEGDEAHCALVLGR